MPSEKNFGTEERGHGGEEGATERDREESREGVCMLSNVRLDHACTAAFDFRLLAVVACVLRRCGTRQTCTA